MKWELKEPRAGDMLRINCGNLYHFGIFVSDDEVIQFGLPPHLRPNVREDEVEVCRSNIDIFLQGGFLEVATLDKKEQKKRRSPAETVSFARSKLGERGYHLLFNNCEHFAYLCVFGEKISTQTDAIREKFRALPTLDVYVAALPEKKKVRSVYPKARNEEIKSINNEDLQCHKYYAWRLLEYGVTHSFGYSFKKLSFAKNENGRWTCPDFEFSISHSGNAVAVALSRKRVGVDIQIFSEPRAESFAERMLTPREYAEYESLPDCDRPYRLMELWAKKESIFKTTENKYYCAAEIDTFSDNTHCERISLGGDDYYLAVTNEDIKRLTITRNVNLNDI